MINEHKKILWYLFKLNLKYSIENIIGFWLREYQLNKLKKDKNI
jgi:hypothetical protein